MNSFIKSVYTLKIILIVSTFNLINLYYKILTSDFVTKFMGKKHGTLTKAGKVPTPTTSSHPTPGQGQDPQGKEEM